MMSCIYIFLGGGLGAISRYGLGLALGKPALDGRIPLGVLSCNILGCFLIGCFFAWQKESQASWLAPLLVTGFLGGFTTFSSFGIESYRLHESGAYSNLAIYFISTTVGGFGALLLAMKLFKNSI